MKHIKLFEQFTSSYKAPKFVKRPAAGDTGYAMMAKYYGASPGPKKKKKNQKTQEVAEDLDEATNPTTMITKLLTAAKTSKVDTSEPTYDELMDASPQILIRNHGRKLVYYELLHDEVVPLDKVKRYVETRIVPAAEASGEEFDQYIMKKMEGSNVLVVKITNET